MTPADLLALTAAIGNVETAVGVTNAKDFATQASLDALKTSIEARLSGNFVPGAYDYLTFTPGATDDVYVFKLGGSGGTTTKTLTINYTGVDKQTIANIASV
jgi:hypothetical protein